MPEYSLEDVAKHNEKSSCWLVIHEGIYDVTKFMEEVSRVAEEKPPLLRVHIQSVSIPRRLVLIEAIYSENGVEYFRSLFCINLPLIFFFSFPKTSERKGENGSGIITPCTPYISWREARGKSIRFLESPGTI